MNDASERAALREMVRKRFKGHSTLKSKVKARYKENLEREYKRIIDAYYEILIPIIQTYIGELFDVPTNHKGSKSMFRLDDRKDDFLNYIKNAFRKIGDEFHAKEQVFGLQKRISKMGELTKKLSIGEWKREVKKTLGIDLLDDYYSGEFYREQLQQWTDTNVGLIQSLPEDTLSEMQQVVEQSYLSGKSNRDIVRDMQERFNVSRSKARFYAVDQMAKLNAAITKQQQTECGVKEYEWSTSGDQRVRDSHRKLNGTIHRWDDPPVVDESTGRRAHPGEDYRCRCVALPVFDLESLDLPVSMKFK